MQLSQTSATATAATTTAATATASGGKRAVDPALAKVATQFEAVFMRQMIGAMRAASLGEGLTDSSATEQFRDMADARTADSMAETGTFGIAELLMNQFSGRVPARPAPDAGAPPPIAPAPEA